MAASVRGEHETSRTFLPAAGHGFLLPLYDPFTKIIGADKVRRALLDQATLQPKQRALEIGCGTGTLTLAIKRRHPDVDVVGLDPDSKALDRARRKAQRAGVAIQLDRGFSDELPYPETSFDRVLSCLMFHHLEDDDKDATLREVRRVLKPGGRLEMVDFAGRTSGSHGPLARWLHSHERLRDNSEEQILRRMTGAGLAGATCVGSGSLLLGRVAYYQASAPR
jgi:ubiquinone/menaquinone biosynthesis C-methylase UbiE